MSETHEMRYDTPDTENPDITLTHGDKTIVTNLTEMRNATERLRGTDYAKVTVSKINGEWLEKPPRLGDEIRLHIVATVVEAGKRLTDDGIQATAKLEVTGITVTDVE